MKKSFSFSKRTLLPAGFFILLVACIALLSFESNKKLVRFQLDSDSSIKHPTTISKQAHPSFPAENFAFLLDEGYKNARLKNILFSSLNEALEEKQRHEDQKHEQAQTRGVLIHTAAEAAGLDSRQLSSIDSIVQDAIDRGAMPGAQVFIARKGRIVYEKAFGHHDYSQQIPVTLTDLYDVASITKIAATTLAAMKLSEEKKLDLDSPLGKYFKDKSIHYTSLKSDTLIRVDTINLRKKTLIQAQLLISLPQSSFLNDSILLVSKTTITRKIPETNIFRVPLRKLLAHQSGITPTLPIIPYLFYAESYQRLLEKDYRLQLMAINKDESYDDIWDVQQGVILQTQEEIGRVDEIKPVFTFDRETAFEHFYSRERIPGKAETAITASMYLRTQFADSLYQALKRVKVAKETPTQYTCLNMILLQMAMDSITGIHSDTYLKNEFFTPLGMKNTTYNPLQYFPQNRIIPTEEDRFWRAELIHGTVHDPSAAMLGGVAGNAGLFSTASDLGILGQMLLNGGTYDNRQYLQEETIEYFTQRQPDNHRGLGFDKPTQKGIHATDLHPSSYGHLGYTGGAMWVDPENEIVFIFLSNRIYPSASNNLLSTLKVRQKVHQVVYDAITDQNSIWVP
ncbi:MAG: hypothetical protein EA361_13705 [Bacteroidetes bacterium]|nr:MAG: hypothetical protein EA361_13705 [Bacteroidota bacterium]